MNLGKEDLDLIRKMNKKIAKVENASSEPLLKSYVFKITAAHVVRMATVSATSKTEAEKLMFEKYGDLPYELIEVKE